MKLRTGAAATIFISSYAPLALILLIKDWDVKRGHLAHPLTAILIVAIAVVSVIFVLLAVASVRQGDRIVLHRVGNQSGELVNYSIPYMISFFEFDLGDWRALISFGIFFVLMFVLTVRTQNIFLNPILALTGYGLYDVEFERNGEMVQGSLLSKLDIRKGDVCTIRQISRFLHLVTSSMTEGGKDARRLAPGTGADREELGKIPGR